MLKEICKPIRLNLRHDLKHGNQRGHQDGFRMAFNESWAFLKSLEDEQAIKESKEYMDMMEQARRAQLFPNHPEYTIENDFQTTLPMHDFTLDENTGYAGVPPVTAIRYTGDYRAGSPVAQGAYNTNFEGTETSGYFPKKVPDVDFNAPSVDAPHGKLAPKGWKNRPPTDKDADYGYPDKGGWLHRDPESGAHYWYKNGRKHFMDVKEGAMGSWWSYPTEEDFDRAAGAESNPTKIVGIRGDPSKYGIVSQRDSTEAPEKLAEMFLQHSKNIPKHALVETAMRENVPGKRNENRMDTARRVGIPKRIGATSRWSNKPLPFSTSRVKKPFEELTEEELYGLAGMDMPMKKAFQLLKERKSLAAFAHKLEYDKQYQKTPKRVKYREQLNAERRKRGIYGKGGKDVSHTQGGKLTLESPHTNRARHFKNRGTLRRVKVKK